MNDMKNDMKDIAITSEQMQALLDETNDKNNALSVDTVADAAIDAADAAIDALSILATPDGINILARVDDLVTLAQRAERASAAHRACPTQSTRQLRDKRAIRYGMARTMFADWLEKLLKEAGTKI